MLIPVFMAVLVVGGCGLLTGGPPTNQRLDHAHALYAQGSYPQAYKSFKRLADQGNADAQFAIGFMYEYGKPRGGISYFFQTPDHAEAANWYRKAAARGSAKAQSNLGRLYANGLGVARSDAEAARWYRKAASQGLAEAQYNLGNRYYLGLSVSRDYLLAYAWASLSATNSTGGTQQNAARLRDLAASKMTPGELSEAQRLAREWRPGVKMATPAPSKEPRKLVAPESARASVEERLTKLGQMRDRGLVTDDEYAEMRKNILRDL